MPLGKGVSLAYGLGSFMRVGENLIGFYLIFYLTTIVGINPAVAGTIGGVSILIGAVLSPVFGRLSDRSRLRWGRRRPFMLILAVPSMLLLTLLFVQVDLGGATTAYYFVVATVFAVLYYGFLVPYDALGASLTEYPARRAAIRSICTGALYLSVLVGGTLVIQLQAMLAPSIGDAAAWTWAVVLSCSIPGAVFGLLAWRATRGREMPPEERRPDQGSFRSVVRLLSLRPVIAIFVWAIIYFFANALLGASLIYLGVFALGLDEGTASTYFLVGAVATFITVAPAAYLVRWLGKRNSLLAGIALYVVVSLIVLVVGPQGYITGAVLAAAFGVTNSIALVCSFAMIYDLREVTELRIGQDMTALALGIFTLIMGVSASFAYTTLGSVLAGAGFDPTSAPTPDVIDVLIGLQTWIPSLLLVISAIALLFWNVDERTHQRVVEELHETAAV